MRRLGKPVIGMLLVSALLASCEGSGPFPAAAPGSPLPLASIQELMQGLVDPAADELWDAVSTEVTAQGEVEHRPADDASWLKLRRRALLVAEAANLLAQPGRVVVHAGNALEDSHVKGILTGPAIEQRIKSDPAEFAARAKALQEAARALLGAIDKRDIQAYLAAGSQLDHACESCHQRYWYPNDKVPAN
jgi:hypothetical protein